MKFRNKVTGYIIDVPCIVGGKLWEPVEEPKKAEEQKPEQKPKKTSTKARK